MVKPSATGCRGRHGGPAARWDREPSDTPFKSAFLYPPEWLGAAARTGNQGASRVTTPLVSDALWATVDPLLPSTPPPSPTGRSGPSGAETSEALTLLGCALICGKTLTRPNGYETCSK